MSRSQNAPASPEEITKKRRELRAHQRDLDDKIAKANLQAQVSYAFIKENAMSNDFNY